MEFIQLIAIHTHTAHIHEYEIGWKMHEFHEYEFHIPWICCEYEFESYEYAMNMNLKAMNMPWIWIQNPWMSSYMNQNCMNMNMNMDANSWNMTNIIALAIQRSNLFFWDNGFFLPSSYTAG